MFTVIKKFDKKEEVVYSVRSSIGCLGDDIVEFLIYDYGWEWVLADGYMPQEK